MTPSTARGSLPAGGTGKGQARTKMTGRELDAPVAHIWTLRNGKAVHLQAYEDVAKWLDAIEEKPQAPQTLAA